MVKKKGRFIDIKVLSTKRRKIHMGTLLEFKKHIKPAVSREDFIDMFFDKKKRQAIYRRFDEKADEPKEDDFVNSMKKKMIHFDE